jgi:hypothetical protein
VAHPKGPVEYPDNKFSKKDLSILRAEPMLTVEVISDQRSDIGGKKSGKKGPRINP